MLGEKRELHCGFCHTNLFPKAYERHLQKEKQQLDTGKKMDVINVN